MTFVAPCNTVVQIEHRSSDSSKPKLTISRASPAFSFVLDADDYYEVDVLAGQTLTFAVTGASATITTPVNTGRQRSSVYRWTGGVSATTTVSAICLADGRLDPGVFVPITAVTSRQGAGQVAFE